MCGMSLTVYGSMKGCVCEREYICVCVNADICIHDATVWRLPGVLVNV